MSVTSKSKQDVGMDKYHQVLLWSIRHQDRLGSFVRSYVLAFVGLFTFLGLSGMIAMEAALEIILIAGVTLFVGLWLLIMKRRSWLLRIKDPGLKREAYAAMLSCIAEKERTVAKRRTEEARQER